MKPASIVRLGVAGVLLLPCGISMAADYYLQPQAEVRAEVDSNRDLVTSGSKTTSGGYTGDVGAIWGITTPLSQTTIQPQIGYVDYPQVSEHAAQGSLDLVSAYHSERSGFSLAGTYNRSDTYDSELAPAQFDPVLPDNPTTPETGRISANTDRTLADIVPKYDYQFNPRMRIGVSGIYERTEYSGDFASLYVPYDYSQGSVFFGMALTPRTDMSVGPFVSRDAATVGGAETNATGGNLAFEHKLSNAFSAKLELTGEQDDVIATQNSPKSRSSNFGATYSMTWTGQISEMRLSAGRTFTPNGAGGTYKTDQVQVEYDYKLSERASSTYAVHYIGAQPLAGQDQSGQYKYADAIVGFKWMLTRTWYLGGGVQFLWLRYDATDNSANNGMVYVSFGYQGLGRRQ